MPSTWLIHFPAFFNLLDFAKSNAGVGSKRIYPKVVSIPASRTADGANSRTASFNTLAPLSFMTGINAPGRQVGLGPELVILLYWE